MTLYKKTREHLNSHWSWLRWSVSKCIVGCNLANTLQWYRRVPPTHSWRYRLKFQTSLRFACRNPHHRLKEGKKVLEWALTIEFGLECRVRLIPPGQSLPLPPVSDTVSYSSNAAPAIAPQQSAFLERPVSPSYLDEEIWDAQKPLSRMNHSLYETSPSAEDSLAITGSVKENINAAQPRETIEQNVRLDPVVQEVIKTFTARIVDIRPK